MQWAANHGIAAISGLAEHRDTALTGDFGGVLERANPPHRGEQTEQVLGLIQRNFRHYELYTTMLGVGR